jgi:hypothetical protein
MKMQVSWDVTACQQVRAMDVLEECCASIFKELHDPEDRGNALLQNITNYLPIDVESHSRRPETSSTPL